MNQMCWNYQLIGALARPAKIERGYVCGNTGISPARSQLRQFQLALATGDIEVAVTLCYSLQAIISMKRVLKKFLI
jgi:hypothetical protein